MLTFDEAQKQAKDVADKNWPESRSPGELIALMHSELSEALEFYRENPDLVYTEGNGDRSDFFLSGDKGDKPDGFWIELADCIIRILHMAARYDVDMGELVLLKMVYNRNRPFKHGGKAI